MKRATTRLRELLAADGLVMAGGAHDALSACIVQQVGYPLCVVTGAGVSVCRGYPDVGLLSLEESARNARYIAEAVATRSWSTPTTATATRSTRAARCASSRPPASPASTSRTRPGPSAAATCSASR